VTPKDSRAEGVRAFSAARQHHALSMGTFEPPRACASDEARELYADWGKRASLIFRGNGSDLAVRCRVRGGASVNAIVASHL
jgi:hypothetical protein